MSRHVRRRRVVAGALTGLGIALAGCSSPGGEGEGGEEDGEGGEEGEEGEEDGEGGEGEEKLAPGERPAAERQSSPDGG